MWHIPVLERSIFSSIYKSCIYVECLHYQLKFICGPVHVSLQVSGQDEPTWMVPQSRPSLKYTFKHHTVAHPS